MSDDFKINKTHYLSEMSNRDWDNDLYSKNREDSLDKIFKDDKDTKNAVAGLFVIVFVVLMILGFINGGN